LLLRGGDDLNHALQYYDFINGDKDKNKEVDGPVLTGCRGGVLGTLKINENIKPVLYWSDKGNVCIGKIDYTNDSKLAVHGKITAEEVKVLEFTPKDNVFYDDYKLSSLEEIEKYIKKNKHLPGIPSGEETKKNGVNLSEMNSLLLQKVEELTLYIIQQQKEIEELKSEVRSRK
jgi:hypothetical protein